TIRVVAHSAQVSIDGDFARTTVSLSFTNRGTAKEGAVYTFSTDAYASATDLEVKIGKAWQKGVLLERQSAQKAYQDITGLDATPRAIDPGLLTKEGSGSFTLFAYPVPPGGTLDVRFTLVEPIFQQDGFYTYQYPDLGEDYVASPKLSFSIQPPTGRTL